MMTRFNHIWLPAPTNLTLSSDYVQIWKIDLQQSESQILYFKECLSSDELARAERFYFPEHRQRFIVGRGSLRTILGRYLGVEPSQVNFDYQQRGKPVLSSQFLDSGLFFNLSHSQNLGLLGVSYQRLIGVDLEYIRPMSDLESLAKRFFLSKEYEVIKLLSPEQQQQVFFRYWTCKEAYLKATGDGLVQLEKIEIYLTPTESAQLLVSGNWNLTELVPADNFAAAVVVANNGGNFQFWQF
jgi:4'-phosphopantetheinyl transferase